MSDVATQEREAPLPWRLNDVLGLYAIGGIGAAALLVSWWGASSTARETTQIAYTVVGIGGVIAIGTANAFWLLSGRRAVGVRRRALVESFLSSVGDDVDLPEPAGADTATTAPAASVNGADEGTLVAVAGALRYHRPGCQLVDAKQTVVDTAKGHRVRGRTRCEVCAP